MEEMQQGRVVRVARGYCFEAPGVFLWDEDRDAIERAAREIASGARLARPTRRMLVIPPQVVAPPQR